MMLVTLWAVTLLAFVLLRVAPGDAAVAALAQSPGEGFLTSEQLESRRRALGLDRPYVRQYADWLWASWDSAEPSIPPAPTRSRAGDASGPDVSAAGRACEAGDAAVVFVPRVRRSARRASPVRG